MTADRPDRPSPRRTALLRTLLPALLACAPLLAACDDGTDPPLDAGNVDAMLAAAVVESDTGVVVNGQWRLRFPHNHSALWLDRFVSYDFGGFPELDYPQSTRAMEGWTLMLTHERERVERNDSLIFRFVDHGDVAVEGVATEKLTERPSVHPESPVGFDNFVRYLGHAHLRITWNDGDHIVFHHTDYADALAAGQPLHLTTTGSLDAEPLEATFSAFPELTLETVENGTAVMLDADQVPLLTASAPLTLQLDRPLDPEHGYLLLHPLPFQELHRGAVTAFIQPRSATSRIVIPASVLAALVTDAEAEAVPYLLAIQEVRFEEDVVHGALAGGEAFALPFVQGNHTSLLLYLGR